MKIIELTNLAVLVLKRILYWLENINNMKINNHRLPKICLEKILTMAENSKKIKRNWIHELKKLLILIGLQDTDLRNIKLHKKDILEKYQNYLNKIDFNRAINSEFMSFYRFLSLSCDYFNYNLPKFKIQLFAQIRLANSICIKLNTKYDTILLDCKKNCIYCSLTSNENLIHIFCFCPIFSKLRSDILNFHEDKENKLMKKF